MSNDHVGGAAMDPEKSNQVPAAEDLGTARARRVPQGIVQNLEYATQELEALLTSIRTKSAARKATRESEATAGGQPATEGAGSSRARLVPLSSSLSGDEGIVHKAERATRELEALVTSMRANSAARRAAKATREAEEAARRHPQDASSHCSTTSTTSTTTSTVSASRRVISLGTTAVPVVATALSGPLPGTQGMPNLGNMCYFSSVLQPLLHSAAFREATLSSVAASIRGSSASAVVSETMRLNQRMWFPEGEDRERLFTDSIVGAMRTYTNGHLFNIGTEDDSAWAIQEYITALIEGDSATYGPLFQTRVRTYQQCRGPAMCVPGPSVEDRNMLIIGSRSVTSIADLIRDQFQAATIAGFKCGVCGSADPGVIRTPTIVRGARVLAISLVRRVASLGIETPLEIDLTGVVASEDGPLVYRLVGIARYHGAHYTSQFRHPDTNEWYSADDSRVSLGSPDLTSTNSRVVIYERVLINL